MPNKQLDEEAIFKVACRITSVEARAEYLQQVCGDDKALSSRVATLLRLHDRNDGFLESPALGVEATIDVPPITEKPGTRIGPYKLIEQIGEGGMGLVFMAQQQEPVKRKVALKVIKPGMDSRQVIARFDAERQALTIMDHPNIARVLDAGSTESGRPYFVMELVKGIPITGYCDQQRLSTSERLELFIPVCRAVQHAHQKGIIHRDIKPSNVMVTLHDGVPVPKVIDFGVAKATKRELTQKTLVTGFGQVIGTPLYMSPEQAELSGLDIDTRTDIYSLGVLLYELLTGTTPFEQEKLIEASYDEMRRIIREEEPPRPSTRISTLGEASATIAQKRHTDRGTLTHQVKGELDWIVMKALEKDRTRRYETADSLANDVQRHLNHEPVEACPPSGVYRLRKFIRRNRGVVMAVAAVAASLVVGMGVATWQAIRATKAEGVARHQEQLALTEKNAAEQAAERERVLRTEAERQRARAEANLRLALEALEEVYVRVTQRRYRGGQAKNEEEFLLHSTLEFYQRFADANRAAPEVRSLVEDIYGKAVAIRQELVRQSPDIVGYRRALAAATVGLASLLENAGRTGEAKTTYEEAARLQEELVHSFPTVAEYRTELGATRDSLTNLLLSEEPSDRVEKHRVVAEKVLSVPASAALSEQIHTVRFNDFSDVKGLQLLGSASPTDAELRLTTLRQHCAGAAWTTEKQLVAMGFEAVFSFRLKGGGGGFAFVIQNHGPSSLGTCGGGEGYGASYNPDGSGHLLSDDRGIPNSLAIEFDTYFNQANDDPVTDHISVQTNGTDTNSVHHAFSLGTALAPCDFDDGNVHSVRIRYVPGALTVFVDHSTQPVLSAATELAAAIQLDRGRAWVGFTAGTGTVVHRHDILSWEYRPLVGEDAADLFFESYPPGTPKASQHTPARAQEEDVPTIEPVPSSEELPFLRKAIAFYQNFADQNRDDPNAQWEIGKAYWRIGEIRTALTAGNGEKLVDEQAEQACQTAMNIWQALGDDLPADADTRKQVGLAYSQRARVCYERGESDRALEYHKRSLQLDPENAAFCDSMAWFLAVCPDPEFRDPGKAVTLAMKAVRLQPNNVYHWNKLGVAQYRNEEWNAAIESLHKSEVLDGHQQSSFNTFFLAMGYWQIDNHDEARRWYDAAVQWMEQHDPDNEELLRFRAEATELLGIHEPPKKANKTKKEVTPREVETEVPTNSEVAPN